MENIFVNHMCNKGLVYVIDKGPNINSKTDNPIKNA